MLNILHDHEMELDSHYDCEQISVEELAIRLKSMIRGIDEYDARAAIIISSSAEVILILMAIRDWMKK